MPQCNGARKVLFLETIWMGQLVQFVSFLELYRLVFRNAKAILNEESYQLSCRSNIHSRPFCRHRSLYALQGKRNEPSL
ncbi:unnamed protein product [Meloidogyne enterolobii]|uniref:Uncharacterized protein n=1 Tax=Meloidogyne enterolobii TaxID=390850 RepID=A0ACB0YWJ7_MELEN